MDDDVVSLNRLMWLVYPLRREKATRSHLSMSQLSLSLYPTTQCQLTLHLPVASLTQTLDYIEVSRQKVGEEPTLDQLLLKLTERKILNYSSNL